MREVSAT